MLGKTAISLVLAILCVIVYEITAYGGIRAVDSEIVFRTSEALVKQNSFAVERDLESWPGFGLAYGTDGKQYSIFGPGEAIVAAPLVAVGQRWADSGFFREGAFPVPISYDADGGEDGFDLLMRNRPPLNRDVHGVRWVAAQLNVLTAAATVVLFYLTALRFCSSVAPALLTAIIYGFGTLAWPYSGTFFSEPLATLFGLAAFHMLVSNDPALGADACKVRRTVLAGLLLGIATSVHLTAILFVPFFGLYALYPYWNPPARHKLLVPALGFAAGLAIMLAALAYYNYWRFGNPLETGRTVNPHDVARFAYGVFTSPLEGLSGLLISPGKGLLLFSPIVIAGVLAWPKLTRAHRFIAYTLVGAIAFRLLFIAARSDWHGGYCIGPRYLVMALPYLCLPLVLLINGLFQAGRHGRILVFASAWLAVCQQFYFSLGEIFSYYYLQKWRYQNAGINPDAHQFYFGWDSSPLVHLLDGVRGPFLLRQLPADNYSVFFSGCALLAIGMILLYRGTSKEAAASGSRRLDAQL